MRKLLRRNSKKKGIINIDYALELPILSVDPALTSGYALYVGNNLVRSGYIDKMVALGGYNAPAATSITRLFKTIVKEYGRVVLVIEMQYPREKGQIALMREVEARSVWESRAHMYNCPVVRVGSTSWQSVEGIKGERENRKKMACRLAGVNDDNEADAILIGRWAMRVAKVAASVQ